MSNYNSTLQSNNTDLQAILNTINELPNAGGEQATPEISVNTTNGLITATAGTKSSTHQLAFQAAKTITPTTASQVAVSSGYYTGGNVVVAGDSNLLADNIKSGVDIFGVTGTYEGSGGDTSMEDGLVTRTISSYTNNRVVSVGDGAFNYANNLKSVDFPNVTTIGSHAFGSCSSLASVRFPSVATIGDYAFYGCRSLATVSLPNVTTIGKLAFMDCFRMSMVNMPKLTSIGTSTFAACSSLNTVNSPELVNIGSSAFQGCSKLTTVSFPKATVIDTCAFSNCSRLTTVSFPKAAIVSQNAFVQCRNLTTLSFPSASVIGHTAFRSCYNLKSLYLTGSRLCTLSNSNAFSSTPIGGYSTSAGTYGSIYVPTSLLTSYKNATNWTYFSSRFVGI